MKTKNTIQLWLQDTLSTSMKYFIVGGFLTAGVMTAVVISNAFQTGGSTPTTTGSSDTFNESMSVPMLTKSGGTFDRNNMSLEAIANALGLPSVGSSKRIFVTSTTYTGNLGGVAGADALCQSRATARSISGSWKAIISASTSNAKDRLNINYTTTTNLKGEVVAFNPLKTGLFGLWKAKTNSAQYEIKWPLIQDDLGVYAPATGAIIWSNTDNDGLYNASTTVYNNTACTSWTVGTNACTSVNYGQVGYFGPPGLYGFDGGTFFKAVYNSANGAPPFNPGAYTICNGAYTSASYPGAMPEQGCGSLYRLLCQEQ